MYNRGDIYYVSIPHHTGCEMAKDRPAVIVSCDALNHTAPIVTVVYLSANLERNRTPGHAEINSSRRPSVALCEQVFTVDQSRLLIYAGHVTKEEMAGIEKAILATLGIEREAAPEPDLRNEPAEIIEFVGHVGREQASAKRESMQRESAKHGPEEPDSVPASGRELLLKELEVYKRLYSDLLDRMTKSA